MPPYVFIEAGKQDEGKVIRPQKLEDFHKKNDPKSESPETASGLSH